MLESPALVGGSYTHALWNNNCYLNIMKSSPSALLSSRFFFSVAVQSCKITINQTLLRPSSILQCKTIELSGMELQS